MDAKPVICLMGPTASGKTQLAIELVQYLPCEIIGVDSAMVYRTMDIGTAKPSPALLRLAPHQLIDIRDPNQPYSAGEFREDAITAIDTILAKNRIPLLVGGTMLYFRVLQQGIAHLPQANVSIRQQLKHTLETQGLKKLYDYLQTIDPIAAQRIHPHDPQRIQRALEIAEITGKTPTEIQQSYAHALPPYQFLNIVLIPTDRSVLHTLIAVRFQQMLAQGFVEEVKNLFERVDLHLDLPAIRTVGYRQIWDYLAGKNSYSDMKERAIIATRQLAKRQLTWLRSWKDQHTFIRGDKTNLSKIIKLIKTKTSKLEHSAK